MNNSPMLLVEDDENDVFFFQRAMKQAAGGRSFCVARDGREAIAYLAGDPGFDNRIQFPLPRLIILDLNLPHKHGLEVLQWIRSSAPVPTVPVVVLTSSTSELDMREAYRFGANSYLIKPSQPDELIEVVRAITRYWFDFNRVPPPCGKELLAGVS